MESRRTPRSHVFMSVEIEIAGATRTVKLRDFSENGALVEGDDLPPVGTPIDFRRSDLMVPGRVAWKGGAKIGIAFDTPLPKELVLPRPAARRAAGQAKPTSHKRPGFRVRTLPPGEQAFIDWMTKDPNAI